MPLPPDPPTPNYVSSRASDPARRVEPLPGSIEQLAAVIEAAPRASVLSRTADSLHAVFVSPVFRFRDDLHAEADGGELQVRSASRVGYSDLGANRRRVEWLRGELGG